MSEVKETMLPLELTLIVAATRNMGIGRAGGLPWTGLKREMAYFARVTKRLPASSDPLVKKNAVIMGRKTWDSIPDAFRPLKGRLNVVLSRGFSAFNATAVVPDAEPLRLSSLQTSLEVLRNRADVGRLFVIGGAEIYRAAMELEGKVVNRILLTRVEGDWECDVRFPVELEDGEGWKKCSKEELDEWVGEVVPAGTQTEAGTEYVFEMWERVEAESV